MTILLEHLPQIIGSILLAVIVWLLIEELLDLRD